MKVWQLVSDVRNIGKFSPETFEAEWLDGATGPAVGTRFRGHVRRNEANHWHYRFAAQGDGTDVTESFRLTESPFLRVYWVLGGWLRRRRNMRDMTRTLDRVKAVAEAP